jgi:hypothetical protein
VFIFVFMRICNHKKWVSSEESDAIFHLPTLTCRSRSRGLKWQGSHNKQHIHLAGKISQRAQIRHPIPMPLKPKPVLVIYGRMRARAPILWKEIIVAFFSLILVLLTLICKQYKQINLEHWL